MTKHITVVLICAIAFFSTTNSFTAIDHNQFGIATPSSYFTNNELRSFEFVTEFHSPNPITVDLQSDYYLQSLGISSPLTVAINANSFTQGSTIYFRQLRNDQGGLMGIVGNTLYGGRVLFQINSTQVTSFHSTRNLVYDSSQVAIFVEN